MKPPPHLPSLQEREKGIFFFFFLPSCFLDTANISQEKELRITPLAMSVRFAASGQELSP